jgi:hypothetical protein
MREFFGPMGTVSRLTVESQAVKTNMLGDPSARVVDVYLPAGHDGQGLPVLVDLVGFTGSGLSQTNWVGFRENLPERLDRLIGEERMPPVLWPFPIAFLSPSDSRNERVAVFAHLRARLVRQRGSDVSSALRAGTRGHLVLPLNAALWRDIARSPRQAW